METFLYDCCLWINFDVLSFWYFSLVNVLNLKKHWNKIMNIQTILIHTFHVFHISILQCYLVVNLGKYLNSQICILQVQHSDNKSHFNQNTINIALVQTFHFS